MSIEIIPLNELMKREKAERGGLEVKDPKLSKELAKALENDNDDVIRQCIGIDCSGLVCRECRLVSTDTKVCVILDFLRRVEGGLWLEFFKQWEGNYDEK